VGAKPRAPGGGRKPLDPDRAQSQKVMVRLKPDLQRALKKLAERKGWDLSKEIRDALYYWLKRSGRPELHIGSLTSFIEVLVTEIEKRSKQRWIDDPVTGVAVCEQVDRLIRHFAPKPTKSVTVPPDLEVVGGIIALAELARHYLQQFPHLRADPPEKEAVVHGPAPAFERIVAVDSSVLTRILEDLGGLQRNQPRRRHK
jgi:hypothetical protein